ncbi:metal ABC transporter permease [Chlamydia trachomatis]|uniref:ABC transport protein, membrane permease n=2 Tax=Chlamydia trachomatis TaxID=813 RepID=A0A6H2W0R9_CHLTB|nr:metal ABC transporter permease [Chlamydia trachomatis]AEJ77200.1 ABC 3 transport family protein [Chlamydia trachomatis L2c]AGJ64425.1 iron ABC transporter [Chlamydia trachomatis L2/434/Bu(i)]AGJ65365.1 iron ABC transporter [Chlamydia trachomatis L2/434/Bu(f)]AGR93486.1 ABC transport protein, membrane permease [Chlamydia trachomatis RC-F/69]AGR94410.1 ABC transport protein, membrane permease [Chlamydia trachomatis RC-L2(s)/46]
MVASISPYYGVSFLEFFLVFFSRLFSGKLFYDHLYIDDIQVIVFFAIAVSCSVVGTFLVLKKMAMYANVVSHTILFGLVCVCLFTHQLIHLSMQALTIAAVSTTLLTGASIHFIRNVFKVAEEASTALVFSLLFSASLLLLVFLTRNAHVGTELVIGNADALAKTDILPIFLVLLINLGISYCFFSSFVCVSFDTIFAFSLGIRVRLVDYLVMLLLSASIVGAFKAVGVLMSLAFLLIPGLIAKLIASSVQEMMVYSMVFGGLAALIAPALSRSILSVYGIGLSTSGLAVGLLLVFYVVMLVFVCSKRAIMLRQKLDK